MEGVCSFKFTNNREEAEQLFSKNSNCIGVIEKEKRKIILGKIPPSYEHSVSEIFRRKQF